MENQQNEPESARESISRALEEVRKAPAEESGNAPHPVDEGPMTLDRLHTLVSEIGTWVEDLAALIAGLSSSLVYLSEARGRDLDFHQRILDQVNSMGEHADSQNERELALRERHLDMLESARRSREEEDRRSKARLRELHAMIGAPRQQLPVDPGAGAELLEKQEEIGNAISQLLTHLSAPKETEFVRDPETGRILGARQRPVTANRLTHSGGANGH